ncbi:MAG TPA: hypothetical protein V6C65_27965 [Allocoleopsis sp.]
MSDEKVELSDIAVHPHIMLVMDEDGDVNIASENGTDLPTALVLLELAKQKLLAMYFQQLQHTKQQKRPTIVVPNIKLK